MSISIFCFNDKLYESCFGVNPFAETMLSYLGLSKDEIVRYIDIGVEDDSVWIATRASGNPVLENNKYYLFNKVDDNDSTYNYFIFQIPDSMYIDDGFENFKRKKPNFKELIDYLRTNPSKVVEIAKNTGLFDFMKENGFN